MRLTHYLTWAVTGAALAALLVTGCGKPAAQNTGGGQRAAAGTTTGGGGGGNMQQFAQFRESHKYTFQLTRMAGNIARLEKEGVAPLTAAQAKQLLAVLTPLRTKEKLTQDEAKDTIKGLKAVLTEQQLTEIGKMKPEERQRMGGSGGAGGSGRAGRSGGSGNGARPRFDPSAMKNFNPFNPAKDSPMAQRGAERWNDFFAALEKKAKGK